MTITKDNSQKCRMVDGCPLSDDCESDSEEKLSACPMKRWSFDELLCEPPKCSECDSLNRFETTRAEELTIQDRKDLSLYWMEHLNRHLERFVKSKGAQRTELERP